VRPDISFGAAVEVSLTPPYRVRGMDRLSPALSLPWAITYCRCCWFLGEVWSMRIEGVTFVGTRTEARPQMAEFVRDVLGMAPAPAGGMDAEVFAMPDGSSFAVTSTETPADQERTVGFRVADVDQALRELRDAGVSTDDGVSSNATQRYVHFRAPDGHLYELLQELGDAAEPDS
jgi:catechol 2,3-dioxygenase-like lactoylglutathione lyase family enzyme